MQVIQRVSIAPLRKIRESTDLSKTCQQCSKTSKMPGVAIVLGGIALTTGGIVATLLIFSWFRREKQKISSAYEVADSGLSTGHSKDFSRKGISPLTNVEYSNGWDPLADEGTDSQSSQSFRFNLEEIESATQYFSEENLLGKNTFAAAYKGVLRDGPIVAIQSINNMSCKTEELELQGGIKPLTAVRLENVVKLRGSVAPAAENMEMIEDL